MHTIVIASQNPVKVQAVSAGFERMYPGSKPQLQTIGVPSGVSHQPLSDAETLQGAINRARAAQVALPAADFWFGLEGGIHEQDGQLMAFAWVVALHGRITGRARTGAFFLPPKVADLVRQGVELGVADDMVFGATNSKQNNGAIGLLTNDILVRATLYEPAVVMALIPFLNPELYPN